MGMYVSLSVKNTDELTKFFKEQCLEVQDDLHVTLAFSRKQFNPIIKETEITIEPNEILGYEILGDEVKYLVLRFDNQEVNELWGGFIEQGASWDYPEYKSHITITEVTMVDYELGFASHRAKNLKKPTFPIILNNMKTKPLEV